MTSGGKNSSKPRWRRIARRIGMGVGGLLLLLVLWPTVADHPYRRPWLRYLDAVTDLSLIRHPLLGAVGTPGGKFQAALGDGSTIGTPPRSTGVVSEINAYGFRGPAPTSDAAIPQIAIVGDEFLFGLGLDESQLAPNLLRERMGGELRVLNLSVIGANLETKLQCAAWIIEAFPVRAVAIVLGPFDEWSYFDRIRQTARLVDERTGVAGWKENRRPRLPGRDVHNPDLFERLLVRIRESAKQAGVDVVFVPPSPLEENGQTTRILEYLTQERGFTRMSWPNGNRMRLRNAHRIAPDEWESLHRQLAEVLVPWAKQALE